MKIVQLTFLFFLYYSCYGFAAWNSRFENLLGSFDPYAPPQGQAKLLTRAGLFERIAKNGLPIRIAKEDLRSAKETYNLSYFSLTYPTSTLTTSYTYSESAPSSIKTQTKTFSAGLGLAGDLGWGLKYTLDLPKISKSLSFTDGVQSDSSTATLGLGVTLNLLKGSVFVLGRTTKNLADVNYEIAKEGLRQTSLQALLSGERLYYTYLLKQIRVKVLEIALLSSKALLEDTKELVRIGHTERLSLIKAELQVAQNETDYLSAQAELESARKGLADALGMNDKEFEGITPDPTEIRKVPTVTIPSVEEAFIKAKNQRPDFQVAQLTRRQLELQEAAAYSNQLPSFDIVSGYGYSNTDAEMNSAIKNTAKFINPQYSIGFQFSYSLFNDADKTAYRQAKIQVTKNMLILQQLHLNIQNEIALAVQNVQLGYRRLKTSELARTLSEKKLNAEFEKFKIGETNIRNVIDFHTELVNARVAEASAKVDLLTNLAVLKNALGEAPEGIAIKGPNND